MTSVASTTAATGGGIRRAAPFALLALAVVVLGLLARDGRSDGEPLDPRSTGPLGARALVLLLERFGADVRVAGGLPPDGATAVLLRDRLNERETDRLEEWVGRGGTLVVTDPLSSFAPPIARGATDLFDPEASGDHAIEPDCALAVLREVGAIRVEGAVAFRTRAGDVGCFPVHDGSFLVARPQDEGVVIALGGGGAFVNSQLADADNSVLAVSLLAPHRGGVVTVLEPSALGGGDRSLSELVSRRVKDGLWQLLVAFGLFAAWRSRRVGRPVQEPQAVQIAGSELVVAVGHLLQQARRREAAASMLRAALRRSLGDRLGVPPDAPSADFAAAASSRAGVAAASIEVALDPRPPADDRALVELARSVEAIRSEVTHAR